MVLMIALWSFMFMPSVTYFTDVKGYLLAIVSAIVFSAPLLKKWSTIGFGAALAIVGTINIMHIMLFGTVVSEYSMLSVKRTTMDESIAFILSIDRGVWIVAVIYLFLCVLALSVIRSIQNKCNFPKKIVFFGVVAIILFYVTSISKGNDFLEKSHRLYPLNMANNFIKSKKIDESMYYIPVVERSVGDAGVDILVAVLGESASAARWSLLGYKKNETNKPLVGIRNAIFTTSISNGPYTLLALPFMLLGESAADAKNNSRASIIDFAKKNGYKTFVFTNSRFYDRAEDFFNLILRRNSDIYVKIGNGEYDENLSYWLESALKDKSAKKLIVLHTYGSHVAVNERYPKEYAVFDDEYDNSIFYTSNLINSWIEKIKAIPDKKSALVYMSDHGLMMPPCSDSYRAGYAKTSFEVPFFIWASENNLISDVKYSLDRRATINSASFYNLSINFLGGKLPMFVLNKTGVFNPKDICNVQR